MSVPLVRLTTIDADAARGEFGTACQRIFPGDVDDDTFGAMACWLDPDQRTDTDEHNQRELVIVQSGTGWVVSHEDREPVGPGDVLLIERGQPHVLIASEEGLAWLSVYWPRIEVAA